MNSFSLSTEEAWIIATACMCAVACAIPGTLLVLKRVSLLGDAISHAILPGLAAGFLISGNRDIPTMLVGACIAGVLAAILSSTLASSRFIKHDAALGIVFTSMFALGVIVITFAARNVDLDPSCILYGVLELTPFDTISVGPLEIPRSFIVLSLAALLNGLILILFFKEVAITTFDAALAEHLGFRPKMVHYGIVVATAITAVFAFEAVGSIIVVAMLIIPGATAYLLAERLWSVIWLAIVAASLTAILGFGTALATNTSVAGMISVMGGLLFTVTLFLSPRHGLIAKWWRHYTLRVRITKDDILAMLFRWHEVVGAQVRNPLNAQNLKRALGDTWAVRHALASLHRTGDVVVTPDDSLRLTDQGIIEARALVRSHRLWEAYLAKHLGLPLDHLHAPSERVEHFIGAALARDIEADVQISKDPHGRSIP